VPHIVNWSMLLGSVVSWGIMWPLISRHEGDWYPAGLGTRDFKGVHAQDLLPPTAPSPPASTPPTLRLNYLLSPFRNPPPHTHK
jgi:hypothetical protein